MPFDHRAVIQFIAILLLVPAQYFITKYSTVSSTDQGNSIKQLITSAKDIGNQFLSLEYWRNLCRTVIINISSYNKKNTKVTKVVRKINNNMGGENVGQSPAVEVRKLRDPNGYFSSSPEPRSPRQEHVKYRIGQVIKHKKWGYRGIIVGWDVVARAPEHWIRQNHPSDKPHWKDYPNYSVVVDTRDRPDSQTTYVAEENIEIITNTQVMNNEVNRYFESWDGAQYIARPWLKELYPHDQ